MGVNFIYSTAPMVDLTEDRIRELRLLIAGLDSDASTPPEWFDDWDAYKSALNAALDCYYEAGSDREVATLYRDCDGISHYISGGMSWGDSPTEAMEHFSCIGDCGPLYERLVSMALEDLKAAAPL